LEDDLRSQIKKLNATLRKRDAANDWKPLGVTMQTFKGKESDIQNVEHALRREIRELNKNLEAKEWLMNETSAHFRYN
jgi:hypothetical protein